MSREEKIINNLFEQARNEKVETSIHDIRKWIGWITLGTVLTGLLTKMKVVFTKSVIMYSTVILTAGIGLGTFFLYGTGNESAQKKVPADLGKGIVQEEKEIQLQNEILPEAPANAVPNAVTPEIPDQEQPEEASEMTFFPFELPVRNPLPVGSPADQTIIRPSAGDEVYGTFNRLKIYGAVNVVITQGTKESVKVEADEKGKSILVIDNKNKTLEIHTNNKKNIKDFHIKVFVTVADLEKLDLSGAVNVSSAGELKSDNLDLDVSGASDVNLHLTVTDLNINISGASDVDLKLNTSKINADIHGASDVVLSGTASVMDLTCGGACDLKAEKLKARSGKITCTGASSSKVHFSESLDIDATGASDLRYSGNPKIGAKSVTGAAKVRQF